MKLEEEIKQKKFRNVYHKLAINLVYTTNWLNEFSNSFLKKFELTQQQFNILRILRGQYPNPASVKLLVERMLDKQCDASRMIERLRLKGLLERKECPMNRRQVDIVITDAGLNLLAEIDKKQDEWDEVLKGLTTEEVEQLSDLLDKLRG